MDSIDLLNQLDILMNYRRMIIRSFDTGSLQLPINATQEKVLMTILKMPDISMKELSAQVGLEKSTLTRAIDSLIAEGMVSRSYGTRDRRRINCVLTEKGLGLAREIDALMKEHIDRSFAPLSLAEMDAAIENLARAAKTLAQCLENGGRRQEKKEQRKKKEPGNEWLQEK